MIRAKQHSKGAARGVGPTSSGSLPYAVELWNLTRSEPERIIARAANVTLARAIFAAACNEHLGRRLVLRRGTQVLMQTD